MAALIQPAEKDLLLERILLLFQVRRTTLCQDRFPIQRIGRFVQAMVIVHDVVCQVGEDIFRNPADLFERNNGVLYPVDYSGWNGDRFKALIRCEFG